MLKLGRNIMTLFVFLTIGTASVQAQSQMDEGNITVYFTENPLLVKGEKAYFNGDYAKSIELLTKALGPRIKGKQLASIENALCASQNALGHHKIALEHCSVALENTADYWMAYVNRGNAQKALGHVEKAYEDYCAAREIAPHKVAGSFIKHCFAS